METIDLKRTEELSRLYDLLKNSTPGSEEYDKVLGEIIKLTDGQIEMKKIDDAAKEAKKDRRFKIGTFAAGIIITPLLDYTLKRSLAAFIGKVEQMETFTSTPGRSIGSWFRWK